MRPEMENGQTIQKTRIAGPRTPLSSPDVAKRSKWQFLALQTIEESRGRSQSVYRKQK